MKLWPTLVRTGVPPCSRTTSGTAFEQMQLWRIVAPGCFSSTPAATIAVVVEPDSGCAELVDEEHPVGVAVEGEADVGADLEHPGLEVAQVLGLDRIGRVVREGAVELAVQDLEVDRQALEHGRHDEAAHAVGRVGHDLERAQRRPSTKERTWSAKARSRSSDSRPPAGPVAGGTPSAAIALISRRPDVLADRPGAGQAQLDAVVLGGVVRRREHRAGGVEGAGREVHEVGGGQAEVDDVEALRRAPRRRTPRRARRPRAACPDRRAPAWRPPTWPATNTAKASPMARATPASSWSGVVPRMS